MKTKILMLLAALVMTTGVFAQQQGRGQRMSPEARLKAQLEMMKKDMSLTADEAAKIEVILKKEAEKMDSLRKTMGDRSKMTKENRDARMQQMRTFREAQDKQIEAVVGAQRYKAYQEKLRKQREMMQQRRGGARPGGGFPQGDDQSDS